MVAADAHQHGPALGDLPCHLGGRRDEALEVAHRDHDVADVGHRHAREVLLAVIHADEADARLRGVRRAVEGVPAVEERRVRAHGVRPLGLPDAAVGDERALVVRHSEERHLVVERGEVALRRAEEAVRRDRDERRRRPRSFQVWMRSVADRHLSLLSFEPPTRPPPARPRGWACPRAASSCTRPAGRRARGRRGRARRSGPRSSPRPPARACG